MGTSETAQVPSRRTVAAGIAWTTPVVITTTAAPAFAASPSKVTGCFTIPLTNVTRTGVQGTNGVILGAGTPTAGATGSLSYTLTQSRTSGVPQGPGTSGQSGEAAPTPTQGDFSIQSGTNLGGGVYIHSGPGYEHWGSTTNTPLMNNATGNLLVLNQGSAAGSVKASETITFTFNGQVPKSVSFSIFDLTRVDASSGPAYADSVSFSTATTVTPVSGNTTANLTASGNVAANTPVTVKSQSPSSTTTVARIDVTAAPTSSSFSMTYSNKTPDSTQTLKYQQSQYVAIGNIQACF